MIIGAKRTLITGPRNNLFGASTPAGKLLGLEPDGIAIDFASDTYCIRDATGAKNAIGTYSSTYATNIILTSDFVYQQSTGTVVVSGTTGSNGRILFHLYDQAGSSNGEIVSWFDTAAGNKFVFYLTNASVNQMNATGTNTGTGAFKWAGRFALNDCKSYRGGLVDTTDTTATMPTTINRLGVFRDNNNALPWDGAKTALAVFPRAFNDSELAAASA